MGHVHVCVHVHIGTHSINKDKEVYMYVCVGWSPQVSMCVFVFTLMYMCVHACVCQVGPAGRQVCLSAGVSMCSHHSQRQRSCKTRELPHLSVLSWTQGPKSEAESISPRWRRRESKSGSRGPGDGVLEGHWPQSWLPRAWALPHPTKGWMPVCGR